MALPIAGSIAFQLCRFLYHHGGAVDIDSFRVFGQSINQKGSSISPSGICGKGYATHDGGTVTLASHVMNYFTGCERQERAPKGEIVPPRVVNVLNTPEMKGYDEMMRKGRNLREVSFHRTFASALPR